MCQQTGQKEQQQQEEQQQQQQQHPSIDLCLSDVLNVAPNPRNQPLTLTSSLSPDGCFAYIVYAANAAVSPAAQFFQNVHGKLQLLSTVPVDPGWQGVDGGNANPQFTLFTLLDDNIQVGRGRVRILDRTGATVNSRILDDLLPDPTFSGATIFSGGAWSHDSRFVVVSYVLNSTSASSPVVGVVRVLAALLPGLPTVATYTFTGLGVFQRPSWFQLLPVAREGAADERKKKKNKRKKQKHSKERETTCYYIAFAPGDVALGTPLLVVQGCPNLLQVLRFSPLCREVVLAAQAALPGFALGLCGWPTTDEEVHLAHAATHVATTTTEGNRRPCCGGGGGGGDGNGSSTRSGSGSGGRSSLIAVNTTVAIRATEITPYLAPGASNPSCTGDDGAELRVYAFDGRRLRLVAAQDNNLRGEGVSFTPNGQFLLSIERAATIGAAFYAINKVPDARTPEKDHSPECLQLARIKGGAPFGAIDLPFSANAEWLLVAGTTVGLLPGPPSVFPIQLFRVVLSRCKNKCLV